MHLLHERDLALIRRLVTASAGKSHCIANLFCSKHSLVGQDAAEFDFRDLRGAKLERLSKRSRAADDNTINATHDEVLLYDSPSQEASNSSTATSPQPAALDASNPQVHLADNHPAVSETPTAPTLPSDMQMGDYGIFQDGQQWRELVEPGNTDHLFSSLNWLWPFDEWSDQIAPPTGPPGFL